MSATGSFPPNGQPLAAAGVERGSLANGRTARPAADRPERFPEPDVRIEAVETDRPPDTARGGSLTPPPDGHATNGHAAEGNGVSPHAGQNEKPGNFHATDGVSSSDVTGNPDQHLINECLAGRTAAFDELVFRYQDRLYNSLVRMLRSAEDARDIAQEAWVHAFQGLTTFRGNSAFYSWLFRIAYNAAVSDKRKLRVTGASLEAAREQAGVEPADPRAESEPSHALVQMERQIRVRTALSHLSEEYRTVLVLKELENLKYEDIAELIGCPIGTVRSRIHRARVELADKLRLLFPNGDF